VEHEPRIRAGAIRPREVDATFETTQEPTGLPRAHRLCQYVSRWTHAPPRSFLDEVGFEEIVERDLAAGIHLNPTRRRGWFTTAYFHHPREIDEEVIAAGWELVATIAIEGPGALLSDLDHRLDDAERRERLLRAIRRIEADPSVLGATGHLLAVARRSGS